MQCVCWCNKVINTAAILVSWLLCSVNLGLQILMKLRVGVLGFGAVCVCN
jgi:hypothetical protein